VYRVSLFEEPEVELPGKQFIVQDASCLGMHCADAISLEISDTAISTSLLLGQTNDKRNKKQFHVNCYSRGFPIIYLKIEDQSVNASSPLSVQNRKQHDNGLRPYRSSLVTGKLPYYYTTFVGHIISNDYIDCLCQVPNDGLCEKCYNITRR